MNNPIDFSNPFALIGALFLLVVIAIVIYGRIRSKASVARTPALAATEHTLSGAGAAYLDSSHIIMGPLVGGDSTAPRPRPAPPGPRPERTGDKDEAQRSG